MRPRPTTGAAVPARAHRVAVLALPGGVPLLVGAGLDAVAAAGLLDDRPATTHWWCAARLAERYPRVRVDPRVPYIDDGDVLTSAGVMAGLDLCLHIGRNDQGGRVRQPARARAWLLERLTESPSTADMAPHAGMSERHFLRRFGEETGASPLQWVLAQRVLLARRLLETTDLPVEGVAGRAGFGTALVLRHHFRRALGTTPLGYRRTFREVGAGARRASTP